MELDNAVLINQIM